MYANGYDDAGYFVGSVECQPDPMTPGSFLTPGHSTLEAFSSYNQDTEIPKWNGSSWEIVPSPRYLAQQQAAAEQELLDKAAAEAVRLEKLAANQKEVNDSLNEFGVYTKKIVDDEVVVRDAAVVEAESIAKAELRLRGQRNARIASVEWMRFRHMDEEALGLGTTLEPAQYLELLKYISQLRDLPSNTVDPRNPVWPEAPSLA